MNPTSEDWDTSLYTSLFSVIAPLRLKFYPLKSYPPPSRGFFDKVQFEFLMGKIEAEASLSLTPHTALEILARLELGLKPHWPAVISPPVSPAPI